MTQVYNKTNGKVKRMKTKDYCDCCNELKLVQDCSSISNGVCYLCDDCNKGGVCEYCKKKRSKGL